MHQVDPEQSVYDVRTMDRRILDTVWERRASSTLFTWFGAIALILSAIGIYGLLSFEVNQRLRELGIRMALGADRRSVMLLVVGKSFQSVAIGIGIGLMGGLLMSRMVSGLIYGINAIDTWSFVGAPFILAIVALLACYVPARRAILADPLIILRDE